MVYPTTFCIRAVKVKEVIGTADNKWFCEEKKRKNSKKAIINSGGAIQTTASESTLVCLLAGRTQAIRRFHERSPGLQDSEINARLVAYCSDQAHSSVEKAALIGA